MEQSKIEKKNETQIEKTIGWILRIGVFISIVIMLIGVIIFFVKGNDGYPNKIPSNLLSLFNGLLQAKAAAWMMIGIFVLILTPAIRVFASIFAFLFEKDYLYTTITTIVFLILVFAAIIGLS